MEAATKCDRPTCDDAKAVQADLFGGCKSCKSQAMLRAQERRRWLEAAETEESILDKDIADVQADTIAMTQRAERIAQKRQNLEYNNQLFEAATDRIFGVEADPAPDHLGVEEELCAPAKVKTEPTVIDESAQSGGRTTV